MPKNFSRRRILHNWRRTLYLKIIARPRGCQGKRTEKERKKEGKGREVEEEASGVMEPV
jgi:hypothetical protein